jgi:biotin operon repressor
MEFKTYEFRPAIIRMHEKGESKQKIAELLGISRHAVRDAIKRFEETGSNANRKREKTARSKKNILRAKTMIKRNPSTKANSTRKLAKKLGMSDFSARKILKDDLKMTPYKLQKRQKLNEEAKKKRRDRCRALLRRFDRQSHRRIIFSDEKLFDIQQVGCFF